MFFLKKKIKQRRELSLSHAFFFSEYNSLKKKKKTTNKNRTKRNKTERNKERKGLWYWDIAAFGMFIFPFCKSIFINIKRGTDKGQQAV